MNDEILRQVEFYFDDINLPRDKFLQEQMKLDDGWIPLDVMLKFKRLAKLSNDMVVIADALAPSTLIDVSEDKMKIRRSPEVPLPENTLEYWQEIKRRTVYMKGFDPATKLDEIQAFVTPHGNVKNVLMRKLKKERTFKGSVFVTFADLEGAQAFAKDESTKTFNGQPLEKLMQNEYWEKKSKATKEKREDKKKTKQAKKLEQLGEQERAVMSAKYVKGVVLEVTGFKPEDTKYGELKDFFKQFGQVAFVAYEGGNDKARIRFTGEENSAQTAWNKAREQNGEKETNDGVVYKDAVMTGRVLEGDEEESYWSEFTKSKIAQNERSRTTRKSGRGGRGGRGGGRGGGGRGGNRNNPRRDRKRPLDGEGEGNGEGNGEGEGKGEGDADVKPEIKKSKHMVFKEEDADVKTEV